MAILLALGVCLLLFGLYQKFTNAVCVSRKNLKGKTALVTGGTSGMGLEIAKDFARRGARVIVACPFEKEGEHGLEAIVDSTGNKNVEFKLLDLSSFESTRKFAGDILKNEHRLDILINNAGIGGPRGAVSSDGLDLVMQVNYYGAFLLTILLLPLLKKTGTPEEPSRIVNTSSLFRKLGRARVSKQKELMNQLMAYADSKICVVSFSREFTNRTRGFNVVMNCVDPGAVGTRIFSTYSYYVGAIFSVIVYILCKTPRQGAQTALHVALDEDAGRVSGEFFSNCQMDSTNGSSFYDKYSKKLWEASVRVVNLTNEELEQCFKRS